MKINLVIKANSRIILSDVLLLVRDSVLRGEESNFGHSDQCGYEYFYTTNGKEDGRKRRKDKKA